MLKKRLSVVVPAYNEENNIESVVARLNKVAPLYCEDYEVIIVDDKSRDNTGRIIDNLAKKDKKVKAVHNKVNLGFGASYQKGLKNARFEYVMLVVGDNTNPVYTLKKIISQIGKADIIVPYYTNFHETKTRLRYLLSITFTKLINLITGLSFRYYNGLSLYQTKGVRSVPDISTGFGFSAEMLVYLVKRGATYREVAVINEDEKKDVSTAFKLRNIIKVLNSIYRIYRFSRDDN